MKKGANQILSLLVVLLLSAGTFSCGDKGTEGATSSMISGPSSKIWKADKELNAMGDKDKLTSDEKAEQIQFFANGNFTQTSKTESANGTWAYNESAKSLTLTYANQNVSETFAVTELDDDNLTLRAPDGSMLELETE